MKKPSDASMPEWVQLELPLQEPEPSKSDRLHELNARIDALLDNLSTPRLVVTEPPAPVEDEEDEEDVYYYKYLLSKAEKDMEQLCRLRPMAELHEGWGYVLVWRLGDDGKPCEPPCVRTYADYQQHLRVYASMGCWRWSRIPVCYEVK